MLSSVWQRALWCDDCGVGWGRSVGDRCWVCRCRGRELPSGRLTEQEAYRLCRPAVLPHWWSVRTPADQDAGVM